MDWLDETYLGRQRFLHQHFGQFRVGSDEPVLDRDFLSLVVPFNSILVPVILGTKVAPQQVGGYAWESMPLEQLRELKPVDVPIHRPGSGSRSCARKG